MNKTVSELKFTLNKKFTKEKSDYNLLSTTVNKSPRNLDLHYSNLKLCLDYLDYLITKRKKKRYAELCREFGPNVENFRNFIDYMENEDNFEFVSEKLSILFKSYFDTHNKKLLRYKNIKLFYYSYIIPNFDKLFHNKLESIDKIIFINETRSIYFPNKIINTKNPYEAIKNLNFNKEFNLIEKLEGLYDKLQNLYDLFENNTKYIIKWIILLKLIKKKLLSISAKLNKSETQVFNKNKVLLLGHFCMYLILSSIRDNNVNNINYIIIILKSKILKYLLSSHIYSCKIDKLFILEYFIETLIKNKPLLLCYIINELIKNKSIKIVKNYLIKYIVSLIKYIVIFHSSNLIKNKHNKFGLNIKNILSKNSNRITIIDYFVLYLVNIYSSEYKNVLKQYINNNKITLKNICISYIMKKNIIFPIEFNCNLSYDLL